MPGRSVRMTEHHSRKLILLIISLAVLLTGIIVLGVLSDRQEEKPEVKQQSSTSFLLDRREYNGKTYVERTGITSLLLMGVDRTDLSPVQTGYRSGGQADFLLLIVMDANEKKVNMLHINRDTMCTIYQLDAFGEVFAPLNGQICLAHAYGSGGRDSCRNQVRAVSELLYDVPIDHYASVTMDAVGIINDMVGGATVTVLDDLTALDKELVPGETVTLQGDQALTYVRARMGLADPTNLNRMKRQQQYLTALQQSFRATLAEDSDITRRVVMAVSETMVSDFTVNSLNDLADMAAAYTFNPIREIEGEAVYSEDRSPEFYADEDALYQMVIDLFYLPLDAE